MAEQHPTQSDTDNNNYTPDHSRNEKARKERFDYARAALSSDEAARLPAKLKSKHLFYMCQQMSAGLIQAKFFLFDQTVHSIQRVNKPPFSSVSLTERMVSTATLEEVLRVIKE